mgnify:CR=1 FL=1
MRIPTEKEARKWIEKARFKKGVEDFVGGVDTEVVVRQGTWLWSGWKNELKRRGISYHRFIEVFKLHSDDFVRWLKGEASWDDVIRKFVWML